MSKQVDKKIIIITIKGLFIDTIEAIYQRRSIKQYDTEHKILPEEETNHPGCCNSGSY
jgi:hypothetical protein